MSPRVGQFPQALESLSRNEPRHSTHGSGAKPAPTRGLITPIFSRISREAKRSLEESHNTMNCPTPKEKPSPADAVSWKGMRDPTLNGALTRRFLREVAGECLLRPVQPGQPPTLNTFGRGMGRGRWRNSLGGRMHSSKTTTGLVVQRRGRWVRRIGRCRRLNRFSNLVMAGANTPIDVFPRTSVRDFAAHSLHRDHGLAGPSSCSATATGTAIAVAMAPPTIQGFRIH